MDATPDNFELGAGFVGVLFALWWNLQYLRFMRCWIEPPYKTWTVAIFRIFFALCFGGALVALLENVIQTRRTGADYLEALKFGLGWGAAVVTMVYLSEYAQRRRRQESEKISGK